MKPGYSLFAAVVVAIEEKGVGRFIAKNSTDNCCNILYVNYINIIDLMTYYSFSSRPTELWGTNQLKHCVLQPKFLTENIITIVKRADITIPCQLYSLGE